jgi:putative heme-binding domain-containing protein
MERFAFLTTNREEQFAGVDFKGGHHSITNELKTLFRPADVAVGPDGAIYVADWFDPRVGGHQDLDDETRGTIYRIAPKGFKPVVPKLDLATTEGQIAALKSPAVNVRALGFMKLKAQGAAAIPAVAALLDAKNPFHRARAIWLLAQLGDEGATRVEQLLRHEDSMMRIAAFRALRRAEHRVLENARTLAEDPSPAVRREVALALRDVPFAEARELLLTLAKGYDGKDRAYLEAWGIGCTGKEADVYAALASGAGGEARDPLKWSASHAGLVWRLTPAAAVKDLAMRAQAKTLSEEARLAAVTAIGFVPSRDAAMALIDIAVNAEGRVRQHATWWLMNYKDSRWKEHGLAAELKRRGLYDPETMTISSVTVPKPDPAAEAATNVEAVVALTGNAQRGAALAQACLLCHRIADTGAEYGPTLTGFAQRQPTEVVIRAILQPSTDIAHGYVGHEIVLKDGTVVHGLVHSAGDPLIVQSTGGFTQMIPADRVQSRTPMGRSLMLNAQQLGLSPQDVADVVAYLKTL